MKISFKVNILISGEREREEDPCMDAEHQQVLKDELSYHSLA